MKSIAKRLNKSCAVCGKAIKVVLYKDKTYRNGHYFVKIPLYKKGAFYRAHRAGTRTVRMGKLVFNVLKRDPKLYGYREYWECPKCYRGK